METSTNRIMIFLNCNKQQFFMIWGPTLQNLAICGSLASLLANFCGEIPNGSRQCNFCTGKGVLTGRALLQEAFGGLPSVRIGCKIARWKGLWVYFPTQLEFFNLEFICPVKNQISQDWSKCAKWDCLKAECCCSQLLDASLNSKLSAW